MFMSVLYMCLHLLSVLEMHVVCWSASLPSVLFPNFSSSSVSLCICISLQVPVPMSVLYVFTFVFVCFQGSLLISLIWKCQKRSSRLNTNLQNKISNDKSLVSPPSQFAIRSISGMTTARHLRSLLELG
jgi:hypothetical protein